MNIQAAPSRNILWRLAAKREYGLLALLAAVVLGITVRNPAFLAPANLLTILTDCAQPAIIACGVMLVIVTGEIDISVGSALGLLTAAYGWLVSPSHLAWSVPAAMAAVLALGLLIGLLNGVLVTVVRMPSIIVTLGMLTALRGITKILMKSGDITDVPDAARFFGIGRLAGVNAGIWLAAAVILATFLMVRYTPTGRRIYAVGSNKHAARLAGVSEGRIKLLAFALTGLLVGVATLILQTGSINNNAGNGLELLVVTCVVVGGVSISGGVGGIVGVVLGVLLLQIQQPILIFMKLGTNAAYWKKAIQGALILIAVLVDHLARRDGKGGGH